MITARDQFALTPRETAGDMARHALRRACRLMSAFVRYTAGLYVRAARLAARLSTRTHDVLCLGTRQAAADHLHTRCSGAAAAACHHGLGPHT